MQKKIKLIGILLTLILISSILISCVKITPSRELELQQWAKNENYTYDVELKEKDGKVIHPGKFTMSIERIGEQNTGITISESTTNNHSVSIGSFIGTKFVAELTFDGIDTKIKQVTYIDLDSKPVLSYAMYNTINLVKEHGQKREVLIQYHSDRKKNIERLLKADYYCINHLDNKSDSKTIDLKAPPTFTDNSSIYLMAKSIVNVSSSPISLNTIEPFTGAKTNITVSTTGVNINDDPIFKKDAIEQSFSINNGENTNYLINAKNVAKTSVTLNQTLPPSTVPILSMYLTSSGNKILEKDKDGKYVLEKEKIKVKEKDKEVEKEVVKTYNFQEQTIEGNKPKLYIIPIAIFSQQEDGKTLEFKLTNFNYSFR